jgi:hypothetical protein
MVWKLPLITVVRYVLSDLILLAWVRNRHKLLIRIDLHPRRCHNVGAFRKHMDFFDLLQLLPDQVNLCFDYLRLVIVFRLSRLHLSNLKLVDLLAISSQRIPFLLQSHTQVIIFLFQRSAYLLSQLLDLANQLRIKLIITDRLHLSHVLRHNLQRLFFLVFVLINHWLYAFLDMS